MDETKKMLDYIINYLNSDGSLKALGAELKAVRKGLDGIPECYAKDLVNAVFGGEEEC